MKILFLGDIVGSPGRNFLRNNLPRIREANHYDFVIANAENAAGGSGITEKTAREIFAAGVDVLTLGDHAFKKQDVQTVLNTMDVIRPLNYGEAVWGRGYSIKERQVSGSSSRVKIVVINLIGRVFMQPVDCPFKGVQELLGKIKEPQALIFVDMHAEATSEKLALGFMLSGKVSGVFGTHTHIPTADERILGGHTAYITDVGMVGSWDSILGRKKEDVLQRFLTNIPTCFNVAEQDVRAQGVEVEVDIETGKALKISRVEFK